MSFHGKKSKKFVTKPSKFMTNWWTTNHNTALEKDLNDFILSGLLYFQQAFINVVSDPRVFGAR